LKSYQAIESIHKKLHDKYNEIFDQFEKLNAKGFFENIALRDSPEQTNFNALIDELKNISKKLLKNLADLEVEL